MLDDKAAKERSQFAEARVLAHRALDLAQRHRVPPFPRAYEVWFTYASGSNPALVSRVDAEIGRLGTLTPGAVDEVYAEFLSPNAQRRGVEQIGDRMGSEITGAIDIIEGGIAHGDSLAGKIERAQAMLAGAGDAAEQRRVLADLLGETRYHTRGISRFGEGLETVRMQFVAMQRELRELRQDVLLDHLTQLPNRRYFDDALQRMAEDAGRGRTPLGLLLIDLDHFKQLVEQLGRGAADAALVRCAGLLRSAMLEGDIACRIDGDTFGLLLPDATAKRVETLAGQVLRGVAEIRIVRSGTREEVATLGASIGAALLEPGEPATALRMRAEDNLLRAKKGGRGRAVGPG